MIKGSVNSRSIRAEYMQKIKDIFAGNKNREHYKRSQGIEIKVIFSSENPAFLGKTFPTQNVDVSKEGFRLELCRELVMNSVLDMLIKVKGHKHQYHLTGNVRWIKSTSKQDHYYAGIVLRHRSDELSDLDNWRRDFNKLIN